MKEKSLEFNYVANYTVGGKSTIELFSGLDHAGIVADDFISEFKYLESISSEIEIKINSSGGSVMSGLSIVTTILDSKIPTTSRIVGVAASMASVIALATDKTVMMDFALLMMHNPFSPSGDAEDDQLTAFSGMLRTIYKNRLGKDDEEIELFMNGDEGKDGTWFNAEVALGLGLITEIEDTSIQKSLEQNLSDLQETVDAEDMVNELQMIAANLVIDEKKIKKFDAENGDAAVITDVVNEKEPKPKNNSNMSLENISASLKIKDATVEAIEAKVKDIVATNASLETKVADTNEKLVEANTKLSEKDVVIASVNAELETANASKVEVEAKIEGFEAKIAGYEAEKAEAHKVTIETMVNEAADAGKITSESKDTWTGLLEASFETASAALNGLTSVTAGKVKLSDKVSAKAEVVADKKVEEVKLPSIDALMDEIKKSNK
tara:strand:- start:29351 stop:30664 length:1314 start_codon:yes stop_codon:yes gene_type:complete